MEVRLVSLETSMKNVSAETLESRESANSVKSFPYQTNEKDLANETEGVRVRNKKRKMKASLTPSPPHQYASKKGKKKEI